MRSSIIGLLVVFAMACGTGAVVAAGGGSSPGNAAQSQYRPPCDQRRPDVPSVDKRFPGGRPPCPVPLQMEPLQLHSHNPIDSFFDIFTELPVPGPPVERPPVPSIDKRFPPPTGPPVPSIDRHFPQGHPPPGR